MVVAFFQVFEVGFKGIETRGNTHFHPPPPPPGFKTNPFFDSVCICLHTESWGRFGALLLVEVIRTQGIL